MKRTVIYFIPGVAPVVVVDDPFVGGDLLAQSIRVIHIEASGEVRLLKDRLLAPKLLVSAVPSLARAARAGEPEPEQLWVRVTLPDGKAWVCVERGWPAALEQVRDLSGCYPGAQFQISRTELLS